MKKSLAVYLKENTLEYMIITDDEKPIAEFGEIKKQCCKKMKYKKTIADLFQKEQYNKTVLCFENSFSKLQIDAILEKLSKKGIQFDEVFKDTFFIYLTLKEKSEKDIKELDFPLENIPNGWINLALNERIVLNAIVDYISKLV